MSSHRSSVPGVARAYFGPGVHPVIAQVFTADGQGWRPAPWQRPKLVSVSALQKLRAAGVTAVQLSDGTRNPDFQIKELLTRPKAVPMFTGSLIGSRTWGAR